MARARTLFAALLATACTTAAPSDEAPTSPAMPCVGKCDAATDGLSAIRFGGRGACTLSPVDAAHYAVGCQVDGIDHPGLRTETLALIVEGEAIDPLVARVDFDVTGTASVDIGTVPASALPLVVEVWWVASAPERLGVIVEDDGPHEDTRLATAVEYSQGFVLDAAQPTVALDVPWTLWPLRISASPALADAWRSADPGAVAFVHGTVEGAGRTQHRLSRISRTDRGALTDVLPVTWLLQTGDTPLAWQVETLVHLDTPREVVHPLPGPGHYALTPAGGLERLGALGDPVDASTALSPVEPAPPAETALDEECALACADDAVCVAGACLPLDTQTQDRWCNAPTAACAMDAHCAEDNACVDGLCRRLACQTQDEWCNAPSSPCGADAHCAEDNVCVDGLCRRLACQTQDRWCNAPTAPCAADAQCAEGNVCVGGACVRLDCQ